LPVNRRALKIDPDEFGWSILEKRFNNENITERTSAGAIGKATEEKSIAVVPAKAGI